MPDNTPLHLDGDTTRTVFNAGVEASFKISRAWEGVQDSALGLDGLRHVIQPFTNFSWVSDSGVNPEAILQFDRVEPTTKLRPIDFPEFTTIDSIDQLDDLAARRPQPSGDPTRRHQRYLVRTRHLFRRQFRESL